MELLELTKGLLDSFGVSEVTQLSVALFDAAKNNDTGLYDRFVNLVGGDLTVDWLQKVYQYHEADRKGKKQDYTPKCLAQFLSRLIGESTETVDLCAGSGALIIQRWTENPDSVYQCYEIDTAVLPYLLFNLAVRNIEATVYHGDALQMGPFDIWKVQKGEKYGKVSRIESAV